MLEVRLNPGLAGGNRAYLRPLCGHDESLVDDPYSINATAWIDRLLVEQPGTTVGPGRADALAMCDCDRLFAALYLRYYGDHVESRVACRTCQEPFEVRFSLPELIADLDNQAGPEVDGPDEEGRYTLSDGQRFRLPTAADRAHAMAFPSGEATTALLSRCVVDGSPVDHSDREILEAAMNKAGPLLDLDLDAACPTCPATQTVRFDIQTYTLQALAQEKHVVTREVHRIATAYRWGYGEILSLTREDRRAYVRLIEGERARPRRGVS